jgi:hypothetical protein
MQNRQIFTTKYFKTPSNFPLATRYKNSQSTDYLKPVDWMGEPRNCQHCIYAMMGCYEPQQWTRVFCKRHRISCLAERQPFVQVRLLHTRLYLYSQASSHRRVERILRYVTQTYSMYRVSLLSCPRARYLYRIERLLPPGRSMKTAALLGKTLEFLRTATGP